MSSNLKEMKRRKFFKQIGVGIGAVSALGSVGNFSKALGKQLDSHQLSAGAARRRVTPPTYIPYLTSSALGTNSCFKGVHDDLWARALVIDDARHSVAILCVDSIGYDNAVLGRSRHFTKELRKRIAAKTNLKPEAIMLAATHTHSAPETIGLTPFSETKGATQWLENHLDELAETVIEAWTKKIPVRARYGKRKVEGISRNRRVLLKSGKLNVHGPMPPIEQMAMLPATDEDVSVLFFEKMDGTPHSVLMNFTAHPVVTMLLPQVSGDYPGATTALVENKFPGVVCLFCNGAAGNVNSIKVSTSFEDAAEIGEKLGNAVVDELRKLQKTGPLVGASLRFDSREIRLKPRSCPSLRDAEKAVAFDPSAKNKTVLRLARKLQEDSLRAEIQVMSLGPVKWIALPGEPFVETGLALKRAGASFVVGYANGWLGYFPVERAYAEGGYEVGLGAWSRVDAKTAAQLESNGASLLAKV